MNKPEELTGNETGIEQERSPRHALTILAAVLTVGSIVILVILGPYLEDSFTLHMTFHVILIGVLAPCLLVSDFFLWWRPPRVSKGPHHFRAIRRGLYALCTPSVAFPLSTAVLWFWHVPYAYDATLVNMPLHVLEHVSLLLVFLAFWAPLISDSRLHLPHILTTEGKVLYILAGAMQGMFLGAIIAFQGQVIYQYHHTQHLPGLTSLEDQQFGGAVMWISGAIIYGIAAVFSFRSSEHSARVSNYTGKFRGLEPGRSKKEG